MTETRGERRAETAKLTDDSELIDQPVEDSIDGAGQQGSKGGNLQRDLATQAEQDQVEDPEAHQSVSKGDHIRHGQGSTPPHPARHVVTER